MLKQKSQRLVKISLIQQGPQPDNKEKIIHDLLKKVDEVAEKEKPDFMMPVELATSQYFCGVQDVRYFDWAETIPGPTTELFAEKAKKYEMVFLLPMYEKASIEGVRYNSTVVLGPDGRIIEGVMPDGSKVKRYAKIHIPIKESLYNPVKESFYFDGGTGFPTFQTPKGKIGITICYDRHFPESWRMLSLQDAEMIFCPASAYLVTPEKGATSKSMYTAELQTAAMQNCVWICNTNRVGAEKVQGVTLNFYGMSGIYHPTGEVVVQASSTEPEVINQVLDLEQTARLQAAGLTDLWTFFKNRRPKEYGLITSIQSYK